MRTRNDPAVHELNQIRSALGLEYDPSAGLLASVQVVMEDLRTLRKIARLGEQYVNGLIGILSEDGNEKDSPWD